MGGTFDSSTSFALEHLLNAPLLERQAYAVLQELYCNVVGG